MLSLAPPVMAGLVVHRYSLPQMSRVRIQARAQQLLAMTAY